MSEGGGERVAQFDAIIAEHEHIFQQFNTGDAAGAAARWVVLLAEARTLGHEPSVGAIVGSLGNAYDDLGQHAKAIKYHTQALVILRCIDDRQGEGRVLGHLGIAYGSLGRRAEAIDHHTQALAIARETGDRQSEGNHLGNLGNSYGSLGRHAEAVDHHMQALAIARCTDDRQSEGNHLSNLGSAYHSLGRHADAIDHQMQALAIAQETDDRRCKGSRLGHLGNAYRSLGRHAEAIEHLTQALAIAREIGDQRGEGSHLGSLGIMYNSLGQYAEAVDHHTQALAIARKIGDRQNEGIYLMSLGDAYARLGQHAKDIGHLTQALAIAREVGDRQNEGAILTNLGAAHSNDYQPAEAAAFYAKAIAVFASLRAELADAHRMSIFVEQSKAYAGLVRAQVALGQHVGALLAADRGRSRALVDLLLGGGGSAPADDVVPLPLLGRTRSAEELEEAIKLSLGDVEPAAASMSELRRVRSGIKAADGLADWPALAALAAQAEATLVFYSKDEERDALYIWVVRLPAVASTEEPAPETVGSSAACLEFVTHPLPSLGQGLAGVAGLSALVSGFGRGVRGARGAEKGSAEQEAGEAEALAKLRVLHATLIEPIAGLLPPAATASSSSLSAPKLIFIPHAELCRVPFPALCPRPTGRLGGLSVA
jgi:tetratricopeptide (TPR) repeat protein